MRYEQLGKKSLLVQLLPETMVRQSMGVYTWDDDDDLDAVLSLQQHPETIQCSTPP